MDFCAGIGGGRIGLEQNGMECVAHSEIDAETAFLYSKVYEDERNFGDLTKINKSELSDFDLLISGFPCQTFSIVGKRKGFDDDRGLIINHLVDILTYKEIPYFIFENVKGLVNHDKGRTFRTILNMLDDAGYSVRYQVVNSLDFGIPQMRERIYIVGWKKELNLNFSFPKKREPRPLAEYLTLNGGRELPLDDTTFKKYLGNKYNKDRVNIESVLEKDFQVVDTRQSDLRVYENKVPTLRTGRHGILYTKNKTLKRITSFEAMLLQGLPLEIAERTQHFGLSETKLLSIAGNAMTASVVAGIGAELIKAINGENVSNVDSQGGQLCLTH